jgi:hypothetical protein
MLIATRQLKVHGPNKDVDVEIRLFKPVRDGDGWICNYEVDWPTGCKKSYGAGVDAIQAILLSLQKIGIELYTSNYHENDTLRWVDQGGGYGFPVPKTVRHLLVGHDLSL